jgi:hypothetical protein
VALTRWSARKLTHLHVFLLGWAYYLGGPVIVAHLGLLNSIQSAGAWVYYIGITGTGHWPLFLYVLLMPLAYVAGDRLSRKFKGARPGASYVRLANWLTWPAYAGLLVAFTIAARELLFSGYSEEYDLYLMGPLATLQMLILFQYLMYRSSGASIAAKLNMILLVATSIILLGMGGRLYVVTSLAAIYFYYWNWGSKSAAARRKSLFAIFWIIIALALVGMWRMGDINFIQLGIYLFVEPLFTSISAFSFMQNWEGALFAAPKDFFQAFLNIVPSWLWQDKAEYFSTLVSEGYGVLSPFGALSIVASTVGNFGFIGGLIFVLLVGFVMGRSRINAVTPISRALYCYLTGLVLFIFFRDPFQIQVKLVLTGYLLAAFYQAISALSKPSSRKPRPRRHAGDADATGNIPQRG